MEMLDVLRKLYANVTPRLPSKYKDMVDVEFIKMADEVKLKEEVLSCGACALHETCANKVPGEGPSRADIMFVSESPGENEEREGRPFVGPSGQVMDTILDAIGWKREDIYITNILKCRTPDGRKPEASELAACRRHLLNEIEIVQPKVIVCWGSLPSNVLIHPDFRITQEIGHWFEQDSRRVMAVYHPSYLTHQKEGSPKQNELKWQVWDALQKVKDYQDSGFPTNLT